MAKQSKIPGKREPKKLARTTKAHTLLTGEWIEKDYLSPERNRKGRNERAELEARFQLWQQHNAGITAAWDDTLRSLPSNLLEDERDRRLALAQKITEIPDELLGFELARREAEHTNNPIADLQLNDL